MAEHEPSIGMSDDWFTPPEIFTALELTFDLDPCSPGPGHWVPAQKIYTKLDDGLRQPWFGLVFMNPPFGGRRGHVPWLMKFFNHRNGIAICRAYTSSDWFHEHVVPNAETLLFPKGKTKFHRSRRFDRRGTRPRHRAHWHGRGGQRRAYTIGAGVLHSAARSLNNTEGGIMSKSAHWKGVGVQTAGELQRKHRRLDRQTLSAEVVVNRMYEEGASLHLYHDRRRGPVWRLSIIAGEILDAVARLVIQREDIVAVGDTLFPNDCLSQTCRYLEETPEKTHD
jgi:hypothetical protein